MNSSIPYIEGPVATLFRKLEVVGGEQHFLLETRHWIPQMLRYGSVDASNIASRSSCAWGHQVLVKLDKGFLCRSTSCESS